MAAVLSVLVEEKIGPGEQAGCLVQLAKEIIHFDYSLALRSPVTALGIALKYFKTRGAGAGRSGDAGGGNADAGGADTDAGGAGGSGRKRDAALVSALSPYYYARVIEDAGLDVVVADVDLNSACLSARSVKEALDRAGEEFNVICVVLNETLGFLPDFTTPAEENSGGVSGNSALSGSDAVKAFSAGLPLIEDCSASFGSYFCASQDAPADSVKKAGTFGTLSVLGLEERDFVTAGGGALLFSAERKNSPALRGFSDIPPVYGIPDMNAAMALVQLREAKRNMEKRAAIAGLYREAAMRSRHKLLSGPEDFQYNNYAFPLILETGMKDVEAYARKKEIAVEPAFRDTLTGMGLIPDGLCPNARSLSLRTVLFPVYPRLSEANAQKVAKLIQTLP